jgi:tRNA(Ile)-lysidine synthase
MVDHLLPFESEFERAWPPHDWCNVNVVLAVSGGADSVALLRAAVAAKQRAGGRGEMRVAHLNHQLRDDSDADTQWVAALSRDLNVPCEVGMANVAQLAAAKGDGLEDAARNARYDFLLRVAEEHGARYVAVAHTANDQIETVLHRILRGTGLAGLAGMPATRPLSAAVTIVRPLLTMRRDAVVAYLSKLGQDFCEDASNRDPRFTRNRLRHELLPQLRDEYNAEVDEALLRLAHQAADTQRFATVLAEATCMKRIRVDRKLGEHETASEVRIQRVGIENVPVLLAREVCKLAWTKARWPLQSMGFAEWQQLATLLNGGPTGNTANFPGGIRAEATDKFLILRRS